MVTTARAGRQFKSAQREYLDEANSGNINALEFHNRISDALKNWLKDCNLKDRDNSHYWIMRQIMDEWAESILGEPMAPSYWRNFPEGTSAKKVNLDSGLNRIRHKMLRYPIGIITAYSYDRTRVQNAYCNKDMYDYFKNRGYDVTKVLGEVTLSSEEYQDKLGHVKPLRRFAKAIRGRTGEIEHYRHDEPSWIVADHHFKPADRAIRTRLPASGDRLHRDLEKMASEYNYDCVLHTVPPLASDHPGGATIRGYLTKATPHYVDFAHEMGDTEFLAEVAPQNGHHFIQQYYSRIRYGTTFAIRYIDDDFLHVHGFLHGMGIAAELTKIEKGNTEILCDLF